VNLVPPSGRNCYPRGNRKGPRVCLSLRHWCCLCVCEWLLGVDVVSGFFKGTHTRVPLTFYCHTNLTVGRGGRRKECVWVCATNVRQS